MASRWESFGADRLHVHDADADIAGAPQNVQAVHRILSEVSLPVQFQGGIGLVHTAELMLGLGVWRVCIGEALFKTPNAAGHFFSRLGDSAAAYLEGELDGLEGLSAAGCTALVCKCESALLPRATATGIPVIYMPAASLRNLPELATVGVEGVVLDTYGSY